jgi:hypothetical protein
MPIFASFFEFCLFLVLLREYLATYYPDFLISCSYECIRAFSFVEIQINKCIASNKPQDKTIASNNCDFEFLLVEHEQETGEFVKIELPKNTYCDGNILDKSFFYKLLGLSTTDKYKIRILDHNVNYIHIDHTHKILLYKDYYLLEADDDKINKETQKEIDENKQKEDSDGFEEFTDMNFH